LIEFDSQLAFGISEKVVHNWVVFTPMENYNYFAKNPMKLVF